MIDKATPMSIAFAQVIGNSVEHDRTALSRREQKEVDCFLHLFNSQTTEQRLAIIRQMFAPSPSEESDINQLFAWLKEVARIMKWTDGEQVRNLLDVRLLSQEEEAREKELDAEVSSLMDELDVSMGMSPPRGGGASSIPPTTPPKRRSPSPTESDVSRNYYDVEGDFEIST